MEGEYETELVSICSGDFEQVFKRKPKNEKEWNNFVHYIRNGLQEQVDWAILYECTRKCKDDICEPEFEEDEEEIDED